MPVPLAHPTNQVKLSSRMVRIIFSSLAFMLILLFIVTKSGIIDNIIKSFRTREEEQMAKQDRGQMSR